MNVADALVSRQFADGELIIRQVCDIFNNNNNNN